MGSRRGRAVDGVVVIDKPGGMNSNDAVQKAKRLFGARKVGHTRRPRSTGHGGFAALFRRGDQVFPIPAGLGQEIPGPNQARHRHGQRRCRWQNHLGAVTQGIDRSDIEKALACFRGEIKQAPPMFSAVKHKGQPLYKLARQGIEVERKARAVTIYSNELLAFEGDELEMETHCSKGTYVRAIAQEMGEMLGCGAHVIALRRNQAGPYGESDTVTFPTLEEARLQGSLDPFVQPVWSAVRDWPEVLLNQDMAYYLRHGQPVIVPHAPTSGRVRLLETLGAEQRFLGVGEILDDGRVAPRRLLTCRTGH